jgi:hypothetical protein
MGQLTKLEWSILDSLSDDREAVALILCLINDDFPLISQKEVAESVYKMYTQGLLFEFYNKSVDYEILLNESSDYADANYWFGLTAIGCKSWEENDPVYLGEPIDWSRAWTRYLDVVNKKGWIKGTSQEVCLTALKDLIKDEKWQVDTTTIVHSKIEGFQAKYYKYIEGGHKITFLLKKMNLDIE